MLPDDLINRAQRFEAAALTEIHDRYYPEVYRYVYYRLGDELVCEDITSEVFLRLLDALSKKRAPIQNLRGWLFGTASNLVNDHLRMRYARRIDSLDADDSELAEDNHLERAYDETWVQQQVAHAIKELTPEQQNVLALRFSEERSLEETASILGKSVTAVKGLQFRAIAALRRLIEERVKG